MGSPPPLPNFHSICRHPAKHCHFNGGFSLSCRAGNILKWKFKQVSKKAVFCYNEDSSVEILCRILLGRVFLVIIFQRDFSFHCRYVVHSYNFFLFPSTLGVTDVEFTLSASSIQFLSHYGFDYNKVCNLSARNLEQRNSVQLQEKLGLVSLNAMFPG